MDAAIVKLLATGGSITAIVAVLAYLLYRSNERSNQAVVDEIKGLRAEQATEARALREMLATKLDRMVERLARIDTRTATAADADAVPEPIRRERTNPVRKRPPPTPMFGDDDDKPRGGR